MTTERDQPKEREGMVGRFLSDAFASAFLSREPERRHIKSLPRVIHTKDAVLLQFPTLHHDTKEAVEAAARGQSGHIIYLDWYYNKWQELEYPIYTMEVHSSLYGPEKKRVGSLGGGHRHWNEAFFYMFGGKGYEEQDGVRYEWEGEGVLCVPSYIYHKHYVDEELAGGDRERAFAVVSRIYEYLGINLMEQIDVSPKWVEHFGGIPSWVGQRNEEVEQIMRSRQSVVRWEGNEPKGVYERYLKQLVDENRWRAEAPRFVPFDSVPWEYTRQGKLKYLIHPWADNCCLKTLDVYVQELPPGGASGKHRQVAEEILFILEGKGYDIHDGVRYDWEKDDLVCIPLMTANQHFNADPEKPAKFVGVTTRWYYYINQGGIQQLEDAPDYRG